MMPLPVTDRARRIAMPPPAAPDEHLALIVSPLPLSGMLQAIAWFS